jgi:hypothetical protein
MDDASVAVGTLASTNPRNAAVAAPARRFPVHAHKFKNSAGQKFPVKTQGIINSSLRGGA